MAKASLKEGTRSKSKSASVEAGQILPGGVSELEQMPGFTPSKSAGASKKPPAGRIGDQSDVAGVKASVDSPQTTTFTQSAGLRMLKQKPRGGVHLCPRRRPSTPEMAQFITHQKAEAGPEIGPAKSSGTSSP